MAEKRSMKWIIMAVLAVIAVVCIKIILTFFQAPGLPEGFTFGNGRTEATEVDITTKIGGRLAAVMVKEGESVTLNQVLAHVDTKELAAQLRRAEAEVRRAEQERRYALAVIAQRKSELSLMKKDLQRSKGLYENDSISLEQLQRNETAVLTAQASLTAAQAQLSNAEAAIEAAIAGTDQLKVQIEEGVLTAPINGRVLYRLNEPGEVLSAGGKVLTILDPTSVYMTVFLPTKYAARVAIGADARIILDGIPDKIIPARVTFVAPRAQFTPKEVETRTEREKLMFRLKVTMDSDYLKNHGEIAKTGVPGVAYIRLDPSVEWPEQL